MQVGIEVAWQTHCNPAKHLVWPSSLTVLITPRGGMNHMERQIYEWLKQS